MRNFSRIFFPVVLCITLTSGSFAQETMRVNMKNGTVMEFPIFEITKLTFDSTLGLDDYSDTAIRLLKMKAFPNPARNHLNIEYSLAATGKVIVEMFTMNGVRVEALDRGLQGPGEFKLQWFLPEIPAGMYICRIRQNKETVTEKIIINK